MLSETNPDSRWHPPARHGSRYRRSSMLLKIAFMVLFIFLVILILRNWVGTEDGPNSGTLPHDIPDKNRPPRQTPPVETSVKPPPKKTSKKPPAKPETYSCKLGKCVVDEDAEFESFAQCMDSCKAPEPTKPTTKKLKDITSAEERQEAVRRGFKHAWDGYCQHAFGYDELGPRTNRSINWLGLGLTILDSLDTLYIMGYYKDLERATEWVENSLNFNKDLHVSVFETFIRVVGGLLSAFDLTRNPMFLTKAKDIADRLLYSFNTTTGLPLASVNLRTHQMRNPSWTGGASGLAEVGTVQLELKDLAYHLHDEWYHIRAEKAMDAILKHEKHDGLFPTFINPQTGALHGGHVTFGAMGDSFFEYLLKQWILTGKTEERYRRWYDKVIDSMYAKLLKKSSPSGYTYIAEMKGGRLVHKWDHLACFTGGMLALGAQDAPEERRAKDMQVAAEITHTCYQMYHRMPSGIAPENINFRSGSDFVSGTHYYLLRPEAVESFFYMWRFTHEQKYRDWGWEVFMNIEKQCRTKSGYCGLRDVNQNPPAKDDQMQSFFLAETLKYLYLLFSPDDVMPLDEWVFNTEAHPFRIFGK